MGDSSSVTGSSGDAPARSAQQQNQQVEDQPGWRDSEMGKTHSKRFEYFLDSGLQSDVTFLVGAAMKEVKAHKLILSVGSRVFFDIFREAGSENTFGVPDLEPEEFCLFLKYLYTGETSKKVEDALPLLNVASKYQVSDLTEWCGELLKNALDSDTAISIYQQSRKYNYTKLEESALEFISANAYKIIKSDQFLELTCENLAKILGRDDLDVDSETDVFEAVMRWGKAECKRQHMLQTPKYLRSVLETIIHLIRFPLVDPSDFSLKVSTAQILTTEELVSVLLYFNVKQEDRAAFPTGVFNSNPREPIPGVFNARNNGEPIKPMVLTRLVAPTNYVQAYDFTTGRIVSNYYIPMTKEPHRIKFKANARCWVTSLGMNAAENHQTNSENTVRVEVQLINSKGRIIADKKENLTAANSQRGVRHIKFDSAVCVRANEWYTAAFIITQGNFYGKVYKGASGDGTFISTTFTRADETEGVIMFEFENAPNPKYTGVGHGYIPEIGLHMQY